MKRPEDALQLACAEYCRLTLHPSAYAARSRALCAENRKSKYLSKLVRFMAKVTFAESGCWEWSGARKKAGYGTFSGSGSTGMACLREGFKAILIEREKEYYEDILRRIAHVSGLDTPLFGGGTEVAGGGGRRDASATETSRPTNRADGAEEVTL